MFICSWRAAKSRCPFPEDVPSMVGAAPGVGQRDGVIRDRVCHARLR